MGQGCQFHQSTWRAQEFQSHIHVRTYIHAITNNYSLSNSTSVYSLLLHISLHLINFKTTLCTQEDSALVQYCRTFLPWTHKGPWFYDSTIFPFLQHCLSIYLTLLPPSLLLFFYPSLSLFSYLSLFLPHLSSLLLLPPYPLPLPLLPPSSLRVFKMPPTVTNRDLVQFISKQHDEATNTTYLLFRNATHPAVPERKELVRSDWHRYPLT